MEYDAHKPVPEAYFITAGEKTITIDNSGLVTWHTDRDDVRDAPYTFSVHAIAEGFSSAPKVLVVHVTPLTHALILNSNNTFSCAEGCTLDDIKTGDSINFVL